ncbi:LysR family transcriptional regulator [Moritella sp. F3]|uniref:LysR family transcriptional regulator n=1 Tax=Moritella sp. F3 TaxID=2718882 RepID=UPI001A3150DD|nr:LysR family transcriptional regulator [Moritella sp. F3]GIC76664.1 transcriptional regulator [Moritella sp. F1]GIC80319.1 transcriptional regulator [Moritella sp. F3]
MISIDDMMVFTKVVETQSFTKAAEQLCIGKARVSQIVTKLEQALNTRLLHRTTRSLSLTDSGEHYYKKCQMIQELATQANNNAQKLNSEPSGLIRISMPFGSPAYINLLSQFLNKHPKIQLDIMESDSYSNLIESRCDIAIRASSALEDSSLYATKIGQFNDIICASPEYLKRFDALQSTQDLLKLDWVSHEIVHGDKQLVLKSSQGEVIKLSKKPKVQVRTTNSLKEFIKNHIGFGVVPDYAVKHELASGELVRILPTVHNVTIPLYAVYQNKALMPLRTRTLIDFLKREGLHF